MTTFTTDFKDLTMQVRTDRYVYGDRLAIEMYSMPGGEYYDDLSINLMECIVEDDNCFFVKKENYCQEFIDHLVDQGVIEKTCMEVRYGSFGSIAHQYRWLLD